MRTLRYLLMMIAVMGVLSVSAQTPKYGTTYKAEKHATYQGVQVNPQLPQAMMSSTGSALVSSGSSLPQAAVSGTTTTYDTPTKTHPGHIRRDVGGGEGTEEEEDPDNPGEPSPIGDAAWPLALLACVYALMRVFLIVKRKKQ